MFYGYGILNNHVPTLRATVMGANGGGASIDVDALAFITAASITDTTQKSAVTQLVTDLKTNGLWTKMKAIYPFVGGTASQHRFNLKDPRTVAGAFYLNFNGFWTHSASGAQPNGTTAYADTQLIPNTSLNLNSTHVSVYLNTNFAPAGGDVVDIGVEDVGFTNRLFIEPSSGNTVYSINHVNGANFISAVDLNSLGYYINNRISSTAVNLFKNNSKIINDTARTVSALSIRPIYLGAHNFVGVASLLSPRRQALATIGDGLTNTEAANLYTAVHTFNTTLSRPY
jgi:hypothetical protein